jgi:hypothetical protein
MGSSAVLRCRCIGAWSRWAPSHRQGNSTRPGTQRDRAGTDRIVVRGHRRSSPPRAAAAPHRAVRAGPAYARREDARGGGGEDTGPPCASSARASPGRAREPRHDRERTPGISGRASDVAGCRTAERHRQSRAPGSRPASTNSPRIRFARAEVQKTRLEGDLKPKLGAVPSEGPGRRVELRGRLKPASLLVAREAGGFSPGLGRGGRFPKCYTAPTTYWIDLVRR